MAFQVVIQKDPLPPPANRFNSVIEKIERIYQVSLRFKTNSSDDIFSEECSEHSLFSFYFLNKVDFLDIEVAIEGYVYVIWDAWCHNKILNPVSDNRFCFNNESTGGFCLNVMWL